MAIAFDSAGDLGINPNGTSLTTSFTNTAGNLLLVGVESGLGSVGYSVTGVTYNGVAMTLVSTQTNSNLIRTNGLFILENPATGTHNVVVSSTMNYIAAGAVSYSGCKLTGQPEAFSSTNSGATASTYTSAVVPVTNNDWAVCFANSYSANNPPTSSSLTRRTYDGTYGAWGFFDIGPISPAASQNMQTAWSPGGTQWISHIDVAILPSGGVVVVYHRLPLLGVGA